MMRDFFRNRDALCNRLSTLLALSLASIFFATLFLPKAAPREAVEVGSSESPAKPYELRIELSHLWLPDRFKAMAEDLSHSPDCQSFEELQRFLADRDQEQIWYAANLCWKRADGRNEELTYVRWPFSDPLRWEEFRDLLTFGEVKPGHGIMAGLSPRAIHMVAADQGNRPPVEVIFDTLDAATPGG